MAGLSGRARGHVRHRLRVIRASRGPLSLPRLAHAETLPLVARGSTHYQDPARPPPDRVQLVVRRGCSQSERAPCHEPLVVRRQGRRQGSWAPRSRRAAIHQHWAGARLAGMVRDDQSTPRTRPASDLVDAIHTPTPACVGLCHMARRLASPGGYQGGGDAQSGDDGACPLHLGESRPGTWLQDLERSGR